MCIQLQYTITGILLLLTSCYISGSVKGDKQHPSDPEKSVAGIKKLAISNARITAAIGDQAECFRLRVASFGCLSF